MTTSFQMPKHVEFEPTSSPWVGRFILQPLEEGYGVTVGNSLRRVLLSSIPGAAIIGVKIQGVLHEFQTIRGVVEDVSQIILNLKEVRLRVEDRKLSRIAFQLQGPGYWKAGIIQEAAPLVQVLNPEHIIATLAEDAQLDVELRIGFGRGYVPADEQPSADFPVGMIPIDAIYTPIKNVVYTIEPFRVGHKTDYERLVLEVKTDGTIEPKEAVEQAAQLLIQHISLFTQLDRDALPETQPQIPHVVSAEGEKEFERIRQLLQRSVEELELSVRAQNCLRAANIKTIGDLVKYREQDLLRFRNFGRKSLAEVTEVIQSLGLAFGMDVSKYLKETAPRSVESM
ncbi:MAG: DNA-directed RNA polymerase subunit alpha [Bacteroidota bacterium]|nr:DNA-directed RNA polymerase subunit alpha [Candidatus Kapabacteria bacterium]MCS7302366.1 DNA-directed RNA polymerase subunit alpha [Candidatus Kapabacteria bacterium]MCX7936889.1 DNA-directed RNA polymerase subunit alpha [Chlorobiota bacterium]MDW8075332.1 DNA-directed RNA polymerase subunit alpha [Bacteroidota bacterium]MDW8271944.1 DNA-directed RNA polymerase subunit alpha [Bacteroidota bacterium]